MRSNNKMTSPNVQRGHLKGLGFVFYSLGGLGGDGFTKSLANVLGTMAANLSSVQKSWV